MLHPGRFLTAGLIAGSVIRWGEQTHRNPSHVGGVTRLHAVRQVVGREPPRPGQLIERWAQRWGFEHTGAVPVKPPPFVATVGEAPPTPGAAIRRWTGRADPPAGSAIPVQQVLGAVPLPDGVVRRGRVQSTGATRAQSVEVFAGTRQTIGQVPKDHGRARRWGLFHTGAEPTPPTAGLIFVDLRVTRGDDPPAPDARVARWTGHPDPVPPRVISRRQTIGAAPEHPAAVVTRVGLRHVSAPQSPAFHRRHITVTEFRQDGTVKRWGIQHTGDTFVLTPHEIIIGGHRRFVIGRPRHRIRPS